MLQNIKEFLTSQAELKPCSLLSIEWSYPEELCYILLAKTRLLKTVSCTLALQHHYNLPAIGEVLCHTNSFAMSTLKTHRLVFQYYIEVL